LGSGEAPGVGGSSPGREFPIHYGEGNTSREAFPRPCRDSPERRPQAPSSELLGYSHGVPAGTQNTQKPVA